MARALGRPDDPPRRLGASPGIPGAPGPRRSGAPPIRGSCPGRVAIARMPVAPRGRSSGAGNAQRCGRASTRRDRLRRGAAAAVRGAPKAEAAVPPTLNPSWNRAQLSWSQGPTTSLQVPGAHHTYLPASALSHVKASTERLPPQPASQ